MRPAVGCAEAERLARLPRDVDASGTTLAPASTDMNSWGWSRGEELRTALPKGGWSVFRTRFQPFANVQRDGGRIVFHNLTGRAEVWLEGRLIGRKNDYGASALTVSIPPGPGERTLTVLVRARPAQPFGFADIVTVEA